MIIPLEELKPELRFFDLTEKSNHILAQSRHSKKITHLPKELDCETAYLVGAVIGDGNIRKEDSLAYRFTIDSTSRTLLIGISGILKRKFGLQVSIAKTKRAFRINFRSKPFVLFMNIFFNIPLGEKSFVTRVPKILIGNRELELAFMGGLIDTDFGKYSNTMGMSVRSEGIKNDVKQLLKGLSIESKEAVYSVLNKPAYHLWIHRKDIIKLLTQVETVYPLQNKERRDMLWSRGNGVWKTCKT